MISYFELLEMIKDGNAPKKIKVSLINTSRFYFAQYDYGEFSFYYLDGEEDENYRDYLTECFLESQMFDKNIEIINEKEENKKIEKITLNDDGTLGFPNGCWTARNMDKAFAIKINEIINKLNSIEQE